MQVTFVETTFSLKNFIQQNKLFLLFTILFCAWYIDIWENSNACSRVLPIATYFENGNFILDKYKDKTIDISIIDGHYYMDKAPLPSMLTLPIYGILKTLGIVHSENGNFYGKSIYITGAIVCGIIPFLLMLLYIAKNLIQKNREDLILMAFITFFSSYIFVFSGTFFAHVLAAAFILIAYINYENKKYFFSGLLCGLAFLTEYTTVWVIFSWIIIELFKHKSIKNIWLMTLGFSPAVLFICSYNYYFTGNPFTMLYLFVADNFVVAEKSTYGLSFPKLTALFGLIFSENRGLLFYAPALLYGLYNLFTNVSSSQIFDVKKYFLHPVFLPFVLTVLFIASHASWDGGWTYGPRHLMSVSSLLIYTIIQCHTFGTNKFVFWFICGYGLICTFLAKLTVMYSIPELDENILSYLISKLKDAFNDGNILSLITHSNPLYAFYIFIAFFIAMFLFQPKSAKSIGQ
ncbi:MAG TPA: hypothetical protein PK323_12150 [Bacteroidia bacterium]|nr:hypothetical protein [Bacteroidia bacterium]